MPIHCVTTYITDRYSKIFLGEVCRIVEGRVHTWGWWRFPGRKGQGAYPVCLVLNVKVGEDFDIRDWVLICDEAALTGRTAAAWQVGGRGWQAFRWCHSWCKMLRRYQDRWYMEAPREISR